MSTQSPEIQARLQNLRQKAAIGTLTLEECREAITLVREGRYAAASAPASKGKKPSGPARSADDMLGELGL